ncbi:MAG TPA: hypothetical protein VEK73_13430, partial [Xanthobacteraceae bacterium]|nr:hypothetical protein [Xanthobacteraceae bacterium]
VDRFTAQFDGQAAMIANVLEAAKLAAEISSVSIDALRRDIAADSAANRTALEEATKVIAAMTHILDEYKADAQDQADALRHLMARTDAAIRAFGETLVKPGAGAAAQTGDLRQLVPAPPGVADDIGARRAAPKREAIK